MAELSCHEFCEGSICCARNFSRRCEDCVLEKPHLSSRSDGLTRKMKAATVRVCAVAECGEAVRWQRVGVAVRLLRVVGGGRASSDSVISIVGTE